MTATTVLVEPVVTSQAWDVWMSAPALPPTCPVFRRSHCSPKRVSLGIAAGRTRLSVVALEAAVVRRVLLVLVLLLRTIRSSRTSRPSCVPRNRDGQEELRDLLPGGEWRVGMELPHGWEPGKPSQIPERGYTTGWQATLL